jgi:hypothetical protein
MQAIVQYQQVRESCSKFVFAFLIEAANLLMLTHSWLQRPARLQLRYLQWSSPRLILHLY